MDAIEEAVPGLTDVTAAEWQRLAERRVFFGHQSVGGNLIDGIGDVLASCPDLPLRIVETGDPAEMRQPGFYHARIGQNGHPETKLRAFVEIAARAVGDGGVAVLKYCYVDVNARTDPAALFGEYRSAVEALKAGHPNLAILHVTMPLRADPGLLFHLRSRLRGHAGQRGLNMIRERYNTLMRSAYADREPVFDLALLESTDPAGRRTTARLGGERVPVLAAGWTDDGGHLNAAGRRRMAEAFLVTLARR